MILFPLSCTSTKPACPTCTTTEAPCSNRRFTQIETGVGIVCELDTCGKLQCQGKEKADDYSLVPATPPSGTYTRFDVVHSLLEYWDDDYGFPYNLSGCAINAEGGIECWGDVYYNGYLVADPPVGVYTTLSLSASTGCAISIDGSLQCWGLDEISSSESQYTNVIVGPCDDICYLSVDGIITCWMGYGHTMVSTGGFTSVDVSCIVSALHPQYGFVDWFYSAPTPLSIDEATTIDPEHGGKDLCDGCVLLNDGTVWCDSQQASSDQPPAFDVPLTSISCSYTVGEDFANFTICGLTEEGEGRCWNQNDGMWAIIP